MTATFTWDLRTDAVSWSDGMFELYGYVPGSLQPTLRLVLEHRHPADRGKLQHLLKSTRRDAAAYVYRHRIVTTSDEIRDVVVEARVRTGPDGEPVELVGTVVDLTDVIVGPSFGPDEREAVELRRQVAHLELALESRDLIGQAKGILMHTFDIDADEAFELIRLASQRANRKVGAIAAEVVQTGELTVD